MSGPESWHEGNARYLSAGLAWLRARLDRLAAATESKREEAPLPISAPPLDGGKQVAARNVRARDKKAPAGDPAPDAVLQAKREFALAETQVDPPPALAMLGQRLGLSTFEQHLLLLCVAMELDTRTADLCARAHANSARDYPTFALALALFDDAAWDALSPEGSLRHWRLIEIHPSQTQPLTTSALRADERIVNYVKGLNHLDERLLHLVTLVTDDEEAELQPSQQVSVDHIARSWNARANGGQLPVIQLLGPDAASKQLVARQAAAKFGRHLYRLSTDVLPTSAADVDAIARLWHRECILLPLALYLEATEPEGGRDFSGYNSLRRFVARSDGLFLIDTRDPLPRLGRPHVAVDVAKPSPAEQRAAWSEALGGVASNTHGSLAAQFNLDVASIREIARTTLRETSGNARESADRLWDACKIRVRPGLDTLAQRLDAKATWDDLVLPAEQMGLLRQISAQVRTRNRVYEEWGFARKMNRGLGISALFAGDTGTGKTMAAEVIANDLRLNLYRIDLSTVISKYIGETEGNLRRLFDAAEDGGCVLFFDECDALFGKRSEVKDSHDRYANIEINYLLQRIEAYRGLAILATNMKSSLDGAFVRRLRFIVNFAFPGPRERQQIWRKAFPAGMPCDELDFERLGRLNIAGGSIHSAALCAAFMAAHGETPVNMNCVMSAIRSEFMKVGRPVNESEFGLLRDRGAAA